LLKHRFQTCVIKLGKSGSLALSTNREFLRKHSFLHGKQLTRCWTDAELTRDNTVQSTLRRLHKNILYPNKTKQSIQNPLECRIGLRLILKITLNENNSYKWFAKNNKLIASNASHNLDTTRSIWKTWWFLMIFGPWTFSNDVL
jgi:hypothetical protein